MIGFDQIGYSANEGDSVVNVRVAVLTGIIREPILLRLSTVELEYENAASGMIVCCYCDAATSNGIIIEYTVVLFVCFSLYTHI